MRSQQPWPRASAAAAYGRRDRAPVSIVVAAHNESDVIDRRVRNLLDLDYPPT